MQMKRPVLLLLISSIIILAIAYGFMPKPVMIETAEVKKEYMRVFIEEEGKTRVKDRYVISSPVSGFALRIDLEVGDSVSKGRTITKLEPLRSTVLDPRSRAEAEARVAASEAALRAAEENARAAAASTEYATKELARISKLSKESLVTQEKLDEAERERQRTEAALRSSQFAVDVARHEKEAALTSLKFSAAKEQNTYAEEVSIKAPVSGKVLKINHKSEGVVHEGEPLIEIGNPAALEVEVDVLSADAVKIHNGTPVIFDRWGGEKPLHGTVKVVEPAGFTKVSALGVEEQRVLVISDITSPAEQWKNLGDGFRVEAAFIIWEEDGVLQAPSSALFRHNNGWAAFTLNNETAKLQKVDIGRKNGLVAQIISGLEEGDIVITHPDNAIEDGTSVRAFNDR